MAGGSVKQGAWALAAALLGLLLAGASAALLATAPAADDRIGVPRLGDVAVYAVSGVDDGVPYAANLTLRWIGGEAREDAYGVPRGVNLAVMDGGPLPLPSPFEAAFHGDSVAPLVFSVHRYDSTEPGDAPLTERFDQSRTEHRFEGFTDYRSPCIARASWQGMPLGEVDGLDVYEACPMARRGLATGETARLSGAGPVRYGSLTALSFRATADPAYGGWAVARLDLAAGIPYPLRLDLAGGAAAPITYLLTGLVRGTEPLATGSSTPPAVPTERPGFTFEPLPRWGVVPGDEVAFDYPPSHAIENLTGPLAPEAFARYLADHPTARVVSYRYYEDRHDYYVGTTRAPAWWFLWNDEAGNGYQVSARRGPESHVDPLRANFGVIPTAQVEGAPVALPPLDPDTLPAQSLALSDAIGAWRALEGPDAQPVNRVYAKLQPDAPPVSDGYDLVGGDVVIGHTAYGAALDAGGGGVPEHTNDVRKTWAAFDLASGRTQAAVTYTLLSEHLVAPAALGSAAPAPAAPDAAGGPRSIALGAGIAAGLLVAVLAGLRAFGDALARHLGAPLYSRFTRADVMRHARRRALLAAVREAPGVTLKELGERHPMGTGSLTYHLAVLERERYVTSVRNGRHRRYFPLGEEHHRRFEATAVLLDSDGNPYLREIRAEPGRTQADIATRVGVSKAAAHKAIVRLEAAGLVSRERDGRVVRVYPRDAE